jgi:hypothetical protein
MRRLYLGLGLFAALAPPAIAAEQDPRVGNWKLLAYELVVDDGQPQAVFGQHPNGHIILTPQGRMMAFISAEQRQAGGSEAAKAKLLETMFAYTGTYRIEGNDFITTVDGSWIESLNGTQQRRHTTLVGDKLTIISEPQPSPPVIGGKTFYGKLYWQRE